MDAYTLSYVKLIVRICCMTWELKLGLHDNVEGWNGVGGEREAQEGGDICISMAEIGRAHV